MLFLSKSPSFISNRHVSKKCYICDYKKISKNDYFNLVPTSVYEYEIFKDFIPKTYKIKPWENISKLKPLQLPEPTKYLIIEDNRIFINPEIKGFNEKDFHNDELRYQYELKELALKPPFREEEDLFDFCFADGKPDNQKLKEASPFSSKALHLLLTLQDKSYKAWYRK